MIEAAIHISIDRRCIIPQRSTTPPDEKRMEDHLAIDEKDGPEQNFSGKRSWYRQGPVARPF